MYGTEKYILLFICSLLLLVSVGSKGKGELPIVVLDFPLDFNFAGTEFDIELSFRTKSKRRLSLEVTSTGTQSKKFREFKYDAIVAHRTEVTQKLKVTILLRDSLAYISREQNYWCAARPLHRWNSSYWFVAWRSLWWIIFKDCISWRLSTTAIGSAME